MVQQAPPEVGTVLDGYRFKGGDPSNEDAWEAVSGPEAAGFTPLGGGWYRGPDGGSYQEGRGGAMVKRSGGAGGGSGGQSAPLVGADARARFMINLGPLQEAQRILEGMDAEGYNPSSLRNIGASALEAIPFDGGFAARAAGGDDYNAYNQAAKTFEAAILPIMSGAAVTPSEAQRMIRAALPQPGDSEEVLAQKARQRRQMINAVAQGIGAEAPFGDMDAPAQGEAPPPGELPQATAGINAVANGVFDSPEIVERDGKTFYAVGLAPGQGAPQDLQTRYGGDGEITADEMIAAGYIPDQESGKWLYPADNPVAPEGPQGGGSPPAAPSADPRGGGSFNPTSGFAAFQRGALGQLPFGEKAAAGIGALLTGQSYSDVRDGQDALNQYDRENNGAQRNLGGVAGFTAGITSAPSQAAGRWVAQAPRLRYAMTRGAAAGAGAGALYGASEADGGLVEQGKGALGGAMIGGATGLALPPAARVVGGMTDSLTRPVRQAVGDGLRRMTGNPVTGEDAAVRSLLRGANPDEMAARLEEGRRFGADLTLADVGGSNVQSRARVAATRQTPGREVAQDFASGRRSEVQDFAAGLGERVSPASATPQQLDDALETYQRQASASAFGAVRGDRVTLNRDSVMALRSEEGRAAVKDAARLYASSTDEAERNLAAELNRLADVALDNPAGAEVTVGAADLMARYLNRAGGMDANRNRVFGSLGRTIRDDARTQNPAYDAALQDFASRARLGDAVETGERFLGRGHTGDFVAAAGGMDEQQRQIARTAARAAIERASETGGSAPGLLDKLATGRGQRQRSAALLGPEGAADLQQGARVGRRMVETGNNVNPRAGSNTYLNAQDDNAEAVGGIVGNIARGRPLSALGGVVDMIRSAGLSDDQAEAIVRLATDPSRTEDAIRILRTRFPEQEARRIISQITPMIAGQSGAASAPQRPQVRMVGPQP